MAGSATNQYIRQVLHHVEPPPPIEARFFYTSPIPIDDPLSPLPPPASAGSAPARLAPKPFSEYDNQALDKAWNALRRKILKYNEERGEKEAAGAGAATSTSRSRPRTSSSVVRRERASSSSKPGTPRSKTSKPPTSGLRQQLEGDEEEEVTELDLEDHRPTSAAGLAAKGSNTTGTPFIRAPSKKKLDAEEHLARPKIQQHDTYEWEDPSHLADYVPPPKPVDSTEQMPKDTVAVGVSRLHQVEMPSLQMTPIYWTPVNDTAQVIRGTWFYQDTMLPVETTVANMLEAGYIEMKVWTETWKDELNSAVEIGAEGEMKIVHKLWPEHYAPKTGDAGSRPESRRGRPIREETLLRTAAATFFDNQQDTVEQQQARVHEGACDIIDVSTGVDGTDSKASGESTWGMNGTARTYTTCGVIYSSDRVAHILKPTLLPSAYYGRRPLANYIRKGHKIGIPVVRGFDQQAWDKLHPPKDTPQKAQASRGVATSASGAAPESRRQKDPDLADSDRPRVTDLIFVIHGIGQKLSQRMESFHFTHAINAFRREVMLESGSKDVKPTFRKDMGGIMVLPINWRQSLSFEEGGYRDGSTKGVNEYTLEDITPDTLQNVRSVISDVMLDVPYYMSHHQAKMIEAVTNEANRVYTLWCKNNPGFSKYGRVHIIAHSLGSVLALDILSAQPTVVPPLEVDEPSSVEVMDFATSSAKPQEDKHTSKNLLFNTHNLFLCGSPAGFFLLLRKAHLRPRPPPSSPAPATDDPDSIYGTPGAFGCIAVQNIYNIINGYDPVACQMNATVDARYAASLKKFFLPTNIPGYWFQPAGATPALSSRPPLYSSTSSSWFGGRPSYHASRLSARELELQRHEDMAVARERMRALNDNGQVDFFLRYGGGVFEIQYLTMLGAHSAYWQLKDFIRVVVMETGRRPGAGGVLGGLRAVRKKEKEEMKGKAGVK